MKPAMIATIVAGCVLGGCSNVIQPPVGGTLAGTSGIRNFADLSLQRR